MVIKSFFIRLGLGLGLRVRVEVMGKDRVEVRNRVWVLKL